MVNHLNRHVGLEYDVEPEDVIFSVVDFPRHIKSLICDNIPPVEASPRYSDSSIRPYSQLSELMEFHHRPFIHKNSESVTKNDVGGIICHFRQILECVDGESVVRINESDPNACSLLHPIPSGHGTSKVFLMDDLHPFIFFGKVICNSPTDVLATIIDHNDLNVAE